MAWLMLIVAGSFEVVWAIGLKYAQGFTRFWPSVITIVAMLVSIVLLGLAMKSLPVGTSYAVWVGVGAVGTAILGIVLLGESAVSPAWRSSWRASSGSSSRLHDASVYRCRVSAGAFFMSSLRPSTYMIGSAASSASVMLSMQPSMIATIPLPSGPTLERPNDFTPQFRQNRWWMLLRLNW